MDKISFKDSILEKSNIGLWAMEMKPGQTPRMYANESMNTLLGISSALSPEETYELWWKNIHPDYYDSVSSSVEKIISGEHAEVLYPWFHPTRGMIFVRCGGIRDDSHTDSIFLQGIHQDVTKIYKYQKDELTGLYTKEVFYKRVEEILANNPDTEYRILYSDIDNFKSINEKYGVEAADELLRYLAHTIKKVMPDNYILGGRMGGDKFVFLQYARPQTREEGLRIAQEVLSGSPIPNVIWKHGIYYTSFERNISVRIMCDRAKSALNSIKGVYGVSCAVYSDKLRTELLAQQQIIDNMEEALSQKEFFVYLQPKHNLHTNKTGGAEALVRWIHPTLGFMNPGVFIPLFEKNGFIQTLDEYVFTKVCELLREWIQDGKPVVPISVNLSRRDFEKPDLAEQIVAKTDSFGIPHELIHIEITETIFSDNPEQTAEIIQKLHDNGFQIELDDFGTGYSSLTTLAELELDVIKLDISLIKNDKPENEKNILNFCSQLVKMLNLQSVAEGVETAGQLERIKSLGCDYIQGYYYSKPLPVDEFEKYMMKNA
ncbi:MAG: EAL domain-containing protein [Lachnospiraceae bacterium]